MLEKDLEDFIRHLAIEKGLSENYQLICQRVINELIQFLKTKRTRKQTWNQINEKDLRDYLQIRKKTLHPNSVKLQLSILRVFFSRLLKIDKITKNPCELLFSPRKKLKLPETLTVEEIRRIIAACKENTPIGIRDRAIIETLYSTGLRVSELCALKSAHVDLDEKMLRVAAGKGGKSRVVPFGSRAHEAIKNYLEFGRGKLLAGKSADELYISKRAHGLSPNRIRQIMRARAQQAGITKRVYPHLARHSFATHLLENEADLRSIQELLGHADISTTQIYTQVEEKTLRQSHSRFHPRG